MGYKGRDVEVVTINEKQHMVMACDSCGGVGEKEFDIVKVSPYVVGRFTARVALMEVVSVGASPQMVSVTISNELSPTGEGIISGINDELKFMNIGKLPMTISTEKNFETKQTGIGITVIGLCEKSDLRIASSRANDLIYCAGLPKVGNEINGVDDPDVAKIVHIKKLLSKEGIHDIIPIGSKGILKEIEIMAKNIDCEFVCEPNIRIDINKSAGPSTCLIFTCSQDSKFPAIKDVPLIKIGKIKTSL